MAGPPRKPAYRGGGGGAPAKAWTWAPSEYIVQPHGGKRGLRRAKTKAARDAAVEERRTEDESPAPPPSVDKSKEIGLCKLAAALRFVTKTAGMDEDIVRNTGIFLEMLDTKTSAERQAARESKPWALRKKHAQEKVEHKERTTKAAKDAMVAAQEAADTAVELAAKKKAAYHDRKVELGKCHDDLAVVLNTKEEDDSDDQDDDESSDEDDKHAQIARLVKEAEASARLLATLRDDLREAVGKKRPPSSVLSVSSSFEELDGDNDMAGGKNKRAGGRQGGAPPPFQKPENSEGR
jgi:hypothetical protein